MIHVFSVRSTQQIQHVHEGGIPIQHVIPCNNLLQQILLDQLKSSINHKHLDFLYMYYSWTSYAQHTPKLRWALHLQFFDSAQILAGSYCHHCRIRRRTLHLADRPLGFVITVFGLTARSWAPRGQKWKSRKKKLFPQKVQSSLLMVVPLIKCHSLSLIVGKFSS